VNKRPGVTAFLAVLLVAALAFTTTLAVIETHRAHQAKSTTNTRSDVAKAAAALATLLFTYDYHDLAKTQQQLEALSAGGFAQRENSQSDAVQEQLRKAQAVGSANVKEVTVSDVSGTRATAFVIVATHVASTQGKADGIAYLHLDLQLVGKFWKVDDVQNLSPSAQPSS
jgi:hypothetical protein